MMILMILFWKGRICTLSSVSWYYLKVIKCLAIVPYYIINHINDWYWLETYTFILNIIPRRSQKIKNENKYSVQPTSGCGISILPTLCMGKTV